MHSKSIITNSPRVDLQAQGRLLVVKTKYLDNDFPPPGGRGDVESFSENSRMRLLRLLSRVSPPQRDGWRSTVSFLTLTMRDFYHPRQAKEFLRTFMKRLYRQFSKVAVIWRMEYQKRGVPHFHLILYNCPYIDKVWIQTQWGEIISQATPFTRIERIKSYKHLMSYASKYAAKVDDAGFNRGAYLSTGKNREAYGEESPGRVWGVWHKNNLPMAEEMNESIPCDGGWWMVRRYCQKFWPWVQENSDFGFTVFCDDPYHALKHIVRMSKMFVNASTM